MGELRDKMERDMLLKNLSDRTRKTYLACVRDFVRFHKRDPRELGDEEIKAFLHHLFVEKKASDSHHRRICHQRADIGCKRGDHDGKTVFDR
jgi:hypothetical protein